MTCARDLKLWLDPCRAPRLRRPSVLHVNKIALKVLAQQYDVKSQLPTPAEIDTLKSLFGDRAASMTLQEIARSVLNDELAKKAERRIPPR
jgi:hypothetical protein